MTGGLEPRLSRPDRFLSWAEHVGDEAPMYANLCRRIATDPDILELVAGAPPTQPPANLLFAAVHYLLLGGAVTPLAGRYPTVTGQSGGPDDPWPDFRAFCIEHAAEITELTATRTVQTNEPRRSTALAPALAVAGADAGRSLALVEFGAAAGLNLRYDRYRLDYGSAGVTGDASSSLTLTTEVRGELTPPVATTRPTAPWRRGVDLQPIDIDDPEQVRWAAALLWPNQVERLDRLTAAVAIGREHPVPVIQADAAVDGVAIAAGAPPGLHLVVLHSFMLNQLEEARRAGLDDDLRTLSRLRPVDRISMEWLDPDPIPMLRLTRYRDGGAQTIDLAAVHHHGDWIEWRDPASGVRRR